MRTTNGSWLFVIDLQQEDFVIRFNVIYCIFSLHSRFSSGLIEAPVISYVGEIGEPEFRNFLMAYTYIGMTFGSLFVSVLNTLMPWRMVAFVCIFVPISSTALLCFVSYISKKILPIRLLYIYLRRLGSRIADLVAECRSITRSVECPAMVTRLGFRWGCYRRIPFTSAVQWTYKIVCAMHQETIDM